MSEHSAESDAAICHEFIDTGRCGHSDAEHDAMSEHPGRDERGARCPSDEQTAAWHLAAQLGADGKPRTNGEFVGCDWPLIKAAHAPVDFYGRMVCTCGDFNCASLTGINPYTEACVICGVSTQPKDSGLCDAHKYDEQLAAWRENRAPGWHRDVGYAFQNALSQHGYDLSRRGSRPDDPGWHECSCGWEGYWSSFYPHVADHLRARVIPPGASA